MTPPTIVQGRRTSDGVVRVSGVLLVASTTLVWPLGFDRFQLPRLVFQALVVVIGITAAAVSGLLRIDRALAPVGALLVVLTASALASASTTTALTGSVSRRFGVLQWVLLAGAALLGRAFSDARHRTFLAEALALNAIPIGVLAVLQRWGFDDVLNDGEAVLRPGSTLGSATYLGASMALSLVLGVGLVVLRLVNGWRRHLVLVGIACSLVGLLLSQARGAWIGALAGCCVVAVIGFRLDRATAARTAGLVVLATVVVLSAVPHLANRALSILDVTEGTAGGRVELAHMGVTAVLERPVLGWGPDMSRPAMHAQISEGFEAEYQDIAVEDRAHNVLIDAAIWGGLLGTAIFLWWWGTVAVHTWEKRRDLTVTMVGAGLLATAGHWWFNFAAPEIDVVTWLLAGALLPIPARRPAKVMPRFAIPCAAVLVGLVLIPSLDALRADRAIARGVEAEQRGDLLAARQFYEHATRLNDGALAEEVLAHFGQRSGDLDLALSAARRAAALDPSDPYLRELVANAAAEQSLRSGDLLLANEALTIVGLLLDKSPSDGSLHLVRGNAFAALGKLDDARTAFARATQLLPDRAEAWRNLGIVAAALGDTAGARAHLVRALSLQPDDPATRAALDRLELAPLSAP